MSEAVALPTVWVTAEPLSWGSPLGELWDTHRVHVTSTHGTQALHTYLPMACKLASSNCSLAEQKMHISCVGNPPEGKGGGRVLAASRWVNAGSLGGLIP